MNNYQYETSVDAANFDYDYSKATGGKNLNLKPGSELHTKLIDAIDRRFEWAKRTLDLVTPEFQEMDKMLESYMPESEADRMRRESDSRKPVTIVVPTMFIMREIFLTYMQNQFLSNMAIWRYRGMGDNVALIQAAIMERINMIQSFQFKDRLRLDTFCSDAFKYGRGVVVLNWKKHLGPKLMVEEIDPITAILLREQGVEAASGDYVRYFSDKEVLAEGTELLNIDMYQAFFDPNVCPDRIQESEFFGWIHRYNVMSMLNDEHDPENRMFNAKYVRILTRSNDAITRFWNTDTGRGVRYGSEISPEDHSCDTNNVHLRCFLWKLIPSEWGLGDSDDPEIWQFMIAGDKVIVQAYPLDERHGKMPIAVIAPNSDGHSVAPIGHLMAVLPIHRYINWLMKTKADASTTVLNGYTFVNDSRVNWDDIMNPSQGKMVRVMNDAYGDFDINKMVASFYPPDTTQNHLGDAQILQQIMMSGYDADMSNMPERPGVAGVQAVQGQRMGRLARIANIIDEQGMRDIAYMKAYNTMQYMSQDMFVPIAGNYEKEMRMAFDSISSEAQIQVSPWDIGNFAFQVVPFTGSFSAMDDTAAMGELMKTLMNTPAAQQQLQGFRFDQLLVDYFRKTGLTDVEKYRDFVSNGVNVQVMPDAQVQEQVQAGNLV
jgi:hypothetical protein